MPTTKFPIIWGSPRIQTLAGNAFAQVVSQTAFDHEVMTFIHTGDVDSRYYGQCYLDEDVLGSDTITAVSFKGAVMANATTGSARCNVAYDANGDGESLDPASLTAATAANIALPATAYLRKDISFSLTAGDFAADDLVTVEFRRDASDTANDTLAADLHLLKTAWLEVTH